MKLLLLLPLLLILCGCHSASQWTRYPGALKLNHCAEYASHCAGDLTARGVEAYYAEYTWYSGGRSGRHAVVLFQQDSKWFVVDNEEPWPRRAQGKTPADMVRSSFAHVKVVNRVCAVDTEGFSIRLIQ